jgi:two-component system sensor histidine kinase UhpB
VLTVRDDGRGAAAGLREGHGLTGMRERLELVGGTLQIDAGPPGFSVTASLPLGSAPGPGALS